jgi:hypothetical protein
MKDTLFAPVNFYRPLSPIDNPVLMDLALRIEPELSLSLMLLVRLPRR